MPSTSGSSSSQWPTWHAHPAALKPSRRSRSTTSSHASGLRLTTTTSAPADANAHTIASPRPRVPPVTTAMRPVRPNIESGSRTLTGPAGLSLEFGRAITSWVQDLSVAQTAVRVLMRRGLLGQRKPGLPIAAAVVDLLLADLPVVQQQVEVPEHLPYDQQGLL